MSEHPIITSIHSVSASNYSALPIVLSKGKGAWVWDDQGNKYLDFMSAYSAVSHGHCHPRIVQALTKQANKLCVPSRAFHSDNLHIFLGELCTLANLDKAIPMNTGAEAVETAIKAARKWGYEVKGIPENQAEIIVAANNFHGRTSTIISFSTDEVSKKNFGPFMPGFKIIPFGDAKALADAITPNTCAVLFEPIQGEAGIIIPPNGWLTEVSSICKSNNVLFILDEIQSGLGRTGKLFAYMHEDVQPDGLILGKSLGGGVFPVSVFISRNEVMDLFTPGSHGSTFGGNSLAAAVGLEALAVLKGEHLVERSADLGDYLIEKLKNIQSSLIKEVRGRGLWIGIDIDTNQTSGRALCLKLLELGVLTKETHNKTIRIAPPLVITPEEIDWALEKIAIVMQNGKIRKR